MTLALLVAILLSVSICGTEVMTSDGASASRAPRAASGAGSTGHSAGSSATMRDPRPIAR